MVSEACERQPSMLGKRAGVVQHEGALGEQCVRRASASRATLASSSNADVSSTPQSTSSSSAPTWNAPDSGWTRDSFGAAAILQDAHRKAFRAGADIDFIAGDGCLEKHFLRQ